MVRDTIPSWTRLERTYRITSEEIDHR